MGVDVEGGGIREHGRGGGHMGSITVVFHSNATRREATVCTVCLPRRGTGASLLVGAHLGGMYGGGEE